MECTSVKQCQEMINNLRSQLAVPCNNNCYCNCSGPNSDAFMDADRFNSDTLTESEAGGAVLNANVAENSDAATQS